MTTTTPTPEAPPEAVTTWATVGDLLAHLGDVPADRVVFDPVPGTATEEDWLRINARKEGVYELVDGVLVRKAMGAQESSLAAILIGHLVAFVLNEPIGKIFCPDGFFRVSERRFRAPDVTFVKNERFPTGRVERVWFLETGFDLAVEIVSLSNTPAEIRIKTEEYFGRGASLVWIADPGTRTVRVHTSPDDFTELTEDHTLSGGDVLPGFELSVRQWFEQGINV
jgi:Uma2 family endonuclease